MVLTGLSYIFVFLPLGLLVYYIVPPRGRTAVLFFISLFCCVLAQPRSLPLLAASIFMDYGTLLVMAHFDKRNVRRACLWFSIVKNLTIILYMGALVQIHRSDMALGVLIYTLSGMECVLAVYRLEVPPERNLFRFGLHCMFFPKLYAGPLQSYGNFAPQLERPRLDGPLMLEGFWKFSVGALKLVLPGRYMGELYQTLWAYTGDEVSLVSSWLMMLVLALSVYYNLSGYSDMAQGIGALFGLRLPLNFYYPYQSRSVGDFVQRFNSTIWSYLQKLVYAALQEDKNGPTADTLNTLICGMLAGLWFGLSVNYLLWGVYLALFVIMERYVYRYLLERIPTLFSRAYALFVVLVGFSIFAATDLQQSLDYFRNMFGLTGLEFVNNQVMYLLSSKWLILALSCFFATNVCGLIAGRMKKSAPRFYVAMSAALGTAMLVLVIAMQI